MTALFAVKTRIILIILAACSFTTQAQLAANFTASPVSGCAPLVVNFTDQSTGNPVLWQWDLGNGIISFNQNPSVTYFTPGQYTIKLVIHNAGGNADSITKLQYITVNAQPTVNFTGTPLTGCFPLPVQFTDQSTAGSGTINTWQWDFGDGASSAVQNPAHTYTASGNYNVTLRVNNDKGCTNVLTKPQYVSISTGVHAGFSNSVPNNCHPPVTINFQNLSTGSGTLSYQWTFGDGGTSTAANPSHTYVATGTYTVRLIVTNNTGCRDTLTKLNSIIIGTVHAAFTSADSVCVNSPLSLTNTSAPSPVSVAWDFGDGTTSTSLNPVKVYSTAGPMLIRLISNFGACTDTTYKTVLVLPKPAANFINSNTSSCVPPLTVSFTNLTGGFGNTYNWNFGDGNFSNLTNPSHTYTGYGTFDVTLLVTNSTGCTDTLKKTALVKIQAPHVTIDNLPKSDCAPLTWNFTATVNAVDPVASYQWDFGDGGTSTLPNPTHVFSAGTYTIRLVIFTMGGCTDTATVVAGIVASTKPAANFSATPLDACAHTPINFTDLSTGTVTRWQWSFGDGGTSTQQNPIHLYEDTGYFNVQLIVWNNGCADTIRFINYIHINPPIASFTADFDCTVPKTKVFTDHSIGADTWNWDFGDGATSTLQNPVHTYANTGIYTVTLVVHNNTTGCSHIKTLSVPVIIEKAEFVASDTVICKNNAVNFTATGSTPANVGYYGWSFGDGSSGSGQVATHTYIHAGTYSVQLTVIDILGCKDTLTKSFYITVYGPTAAFSLTSPGNCLLSAVSFTDNTVTDGVHPIASWTWNYGDGITETLTSPPFQHTYALPGIYSIWLKVTDTQGCTDSISTPGAITISKPVAAFSSTDTATCPLKTVNFHDASTGPSLNYNWNFGDGGTSIVSNPTHSYTTDGLYTVKLLITDQYGCTDSITRLNYIKVASPHANFDLSDSVGTCPPLFVNFTNTSQNYIAVNWDFGDGTSTQTDNPSHFYSTPGIYFAKLMITSIGGCIDSFQRRIVVRGPQGNFTYGPLSGCSPLPIHFTASTLDRLSFVWDFSDGTVTSTTDSVITHIYTIPGNYVPKMILIDPGGCQVPITGPDTIVVKGALAKFGFANHPLCDTGLVAFTDSTISNDVIVSYAWNFGDGGNSTIQNPAHFYATTGIYYPQLSVITQLGCKDTAVTVTPVKIVASPQADITSSGSGCAPLTVSFTGILNVPDTSAMNWAWDFGNGNTSILQNPPAQLYSTIGTFAIKLIASNSTGCKDTVTRSIDTYLVPTISAGADTLICRGTGVTLTATGASTYSWSPPAGLSCTNCANPLANPDSVTTYVVRGTTALGCSNTDTVEVKVKQRFVMNSSPGDTLCKGGSVRLFASGAYSYNWSPANGLNSTSTATPLARPTATTTYQVIGTDDKACFKDTGYITVRVFPIPTVEAGVDKTINVGQTIELKPTVSPDVSSVLWIPTGSIVRSNFPAVSVKPVETTNYTVEVRNAGGCKSRDMLTVFVVCNGANVFIPNTFSPNGDGANDIFYPRGTGLFSIKTLRIFNRWGEVVFEKSGFMPNDASAGWDGKHNGQKLTPDVYVYTAEIICDNSSILVFKGNVTLLQ